MKAIKTIFLAWRAGKGSSRFIVGEIIKNANKGIIFKYLKDDIERAKKQGFTPYTDFPEIDKEYKENVIEVFGQRLIKAERMDINRFLDFWDIDPQYVHDKYYMLAYTQGMLSTDKFEFLAEFHPVKGLKFISEIASLSHLKLAPNFLKEGDVLNWALQKGNAFDRYAVSLSKDNIDIGYIKTVHNRVFSKSKRQDNIYIIVKKIDQSEFINRVFLEISFN
jgi:hypothetical protein